MSVPVAMEIALREELKSIDRVMGTLNTKRDAIVQLLEAYKPEDAPDATDTAAPMMNSMDMARVVIRNAGRPIKPEKIRSGIRQTFGIDAPKTLPDMLWKKARREDSGFFKDDDGNIGLHEMTPKMETVHTSVNSVA